MSIDGDPGSVPIDSGPDDRSKPAQVADRATSAAGDVASTATTGAKDVAGEAATQAKVVAGEAKRQVGNVVDQTRHELAQQAEQRTRQAAGGLRTLADQVAALAEGRPGDAGPLAGYLDDARVRVSTIADRLERAAQGLLDDVTDFARRRPVVFLAAAGAAGFARRPPGPGRARRPAGQTATRRPHRTPPTRPRRRRRCRRPTRSSSCRRHPGRRRSVRHHGAVTPMSATPTYDPATQPKRPDASLGELLSEMTSDLSGLFRKEVELAKIEARDEAAAAPARRLVCSAAAASPRGLAIMCLSFALAWLLDQGLNTALSFAIVGRAVGHRRRRARERSGAASCDDVRTLPQTTETIKEDVQWAKAQKS